MSVAVEPLFQGGRPCPPSKCVEGPRLRAQIGVSLCAPCCHCATGEPERQVRGTAAWPGAEVRLRYAYFITCREVVKNAKDEVVELRLIHTEVVLQLRQRDRRQHKITVGDHHKHRRIERNGFSGGNHGNGNERYRDHDSSDAQWRTERDVYRQVCSYGRRGSQRQSHRHLNGNQSDADYSSIGDGSGSWRLECESDQPQLRQRKRREHRVALRDDYKYRRIERLGFSGRNHRKRI